ncbi:MAG: metal ABC transporter permease, partial [Snodgrassella sp.]|nr:metal ABC transporter permease [Snodgrassella sp.]
MNIAQLLLEPFADYDFMRFALCSIVFLAVGAAPVGVFLMMRRMSLVGDALGHAILPGAAVGYMLAGLSLPAMSIGGFMAGLLMALLAGLASRFANVREDASFAAFFLTCLALGVVLVSRGGNSVDLLNLLFGSILSVDRAALTLVAIVSSITMVVLAVI